MLTPVEAADALDTAVSIGFAEICDDFPHELEPEYFPSKIGGHPAWLNPHGIPVDQNRCVSHQTTRTSNPVLARAIFLQPFSLRGCFCVFSLVACMQPHCAAPLTFLLQIYTGGPAEPFHRPGTFHRYIRIIQLLTWHEPFLTHFCSFPRLSFWSHSGLLLTPFSDRHLFALPPQDVVPVHLPFLRLPCPETTRCR